MRTELSSVVLVPARMAWLWRRRSIAGLEAGTESAWLYIGNNYLQLLAWERILGSDGRVPLGGLLHDAAWRLRTPYVNWLGEVGRGYGDDQAWWYSLVSEKDTTCNDLFLELCYLHVLQGLAEDHNLPNVLVVENAALLLAAKRHLASLGLHVSVAGGAFLCLLAAQGAEWLRFASGWMYKIGRIAQRVFAAQQTRRFGECLPADPGRPRALLFFWVDDASLCSDGILRNRYFTQLPEFLAALGYDVVNIARPHKINQSYHSAFSWLRRFGKTLIPEDYMTWRDLFAGVGLLFRMLWLPQNVPPFMGIDVRDLMFRERLRQASNAMFIQFLAYRTMIAKLKSQGFRIDAYLYVFENMVLERPIVAALREHYPETRIVGFQHTTVTPFMLKFSAWPECFSKGVRYFPDEIVCNGPGYREAMEVSGFPSARLRIGPALRYLYLWQAAANGADSEPTIVLVTLPLSFPLAVEVLRKALELSADGQIPVAIKPHPFADRTRLLAVLGLSGLPKGTQWCEGPLSEWLDRAVCVVSIGSGTLVEAVCSGVPIVILGSETGLEFNPLGWWEKEDAMFRATGNLAETRARIRELMAMTSSARVDRMARISRRVMSMFEPWRPNEVERLANGWLGSPGVAHDR